MGVLSGLKSRQQELLTIIAEFADLPENKGSLRDGELARRQDMMARLGECMKRHLGAEDREIYPALLIHEDPRLKSLAWGFISGEKPLRKKYEGFHARWLRETSAGDCDAFVSDALELVRMIEERIEREQHVLVPKLERSGLFQAVGA